ncbi:Tfp pilus assembly protein FimT [Serratia quinivorans]|uniref:type II secretion system minor pseudopilin GspH n=2 Tax=Serratia quinivorans TaxID=137545 RepID=UPI002178AB12|nr:type II secretion system minor pseudopilin GspH [Serratia quinivorans]CAI0803773.1 Tfp pilus assembly protein FimT [Serratia quinivorans]CAI1717790.1 Tfp pilus assembly protein FimT [Serratia quinivorans]
MANGIAKTISPMAPNGRPYQRGFTLLEIMLVLVLIGLTGAVLVPHGRSDRALFSTTMSTLILALDAAQQRAEQTGLPVGIAVSEQGWQRMIYRLRDRPEATEGWRADGVHTVILPETLSLSLRLELQEIALPPSLTPDVTPQLWFYPGGEMSVFTLRLRQGACERVLETSGYMSFSSGDESCDDAQAP